MRDAADRGTQTEPRDRKRKFACLSLSSSLGLRGKSKEVPHSGAGDLEPQNNPFFPAVPLFRRDTWEERVGKTADLSPAPFRQLGRAGALPARDPAVQAALGACGIPFRLHLSRPPSIWQGFLLRAYCARGVLTAHGGRSGARVPAAPTLPSQPLFLGASGRPGSDLVVYL